MADFAPSGAVLLRRIKQLLLERAPTFSLAASLKKASPEHQIHFQIEAPSGLVLLACGWDPSRVHLLTDDELLSELRRELEAELDTVQRQVMALHLSYDNSGSPYEVPTEQRDRYRALFRQRQELEHLLAALSTQASEAGS